MTHWMQYSIGGKFPLHKLSTIPKYSGRWYFLFEPQLLVRVEGDVELPQDASWGDAAESSPSGDQGKYFYGEVSFYGSEELNEANADFLHSTSELVKVLVKKNLNTFLMQRKHVHLLCNQFGMTRWRESLFLLRCFWRAIYLAAQKK